MASYANANVASFKPNQIVMPASRRLSAHTSMTAPIASNKIPNTPARPALNSMSLASSASSAGSRDDSQDLFDRNLSNISRPDTPLTPFDIGLDSLVVEKPPPIWVGSEGFLDANVIEYPVLRKQARRAGHSDGSPKRTKKSRKPPMVATSNLEPQNFLNQLMEGQRGEAGPHCLSPEIPDACEDLSEDDDRFFKRYRRDDLTRSANPVSEAKNTIKYPRIAVDGAVEMNDSTTLGAIQQISDEDGENSDEGSQDNPTDDEDCVLDIEYGVRFSNYSTFKTPREINDDICKLLRTPRTSASVEDTGYVYVYKAPKETPKHFKIGSTKVTPEKRTKQWQKKCKMLLEAVEIGNEHGDAFPLYYLVEQLVMAEFHNERRTYECTMHSKMIKHKEWYAIDIGTALHAIRRWKCWLVTQQPFDESGNLKEYWQWKVQRLRESLDTVDWDVWTTPLTGTSLLKDNINYYGEMYGKGYFRRMRAHLGRKDKHFWVVGLFIISLLKIWFGIFGVVLGLIALVML